MKILVTGGSGFIGNALMMELDKRGHSPISFDLKPSKTFPTTIGNITNRSEVFDAVNGIDYVYHLAAIADLNYARENIDETIRVNVGGTYNVALTCRRFNVPLLFASTLCVYGETPEHPSWEDSLLIPTEIYALTKIVGEYIVQRVAPHFLIMRFGTTYGPGMRDALAINIFIRQALANQRLTIDGTGEQTRQFIYIDDLTDALVRALDRDFYRGILAVAGDEELSVNQIADQILESLGKPRSMKVYRPDRPGQIMREDISIEKARKTLGWTPKTSFGEGLRKTIEWMRETN